MGVARFTGATFKGAAEFPRATFERAAGFMGVRFEGDAEFMGATFKDYAEFEGATFEIKQGEAQVLRLRQHVQGEIIGAGSVALADRRT
jgi:Pentapeptide repeats (9 copies)